MHPDREELTGRVSCWFLSHTEMWGMKEVVLLLLLLTWELPRNDMHKNV